MLGAFLQRFSRRRADSGAPGDAAGHRAEAGQSAYSMLDEVDKVVRQAIVQARRVLVFVVGSSVVLIGIVMFVTPGPAIIVIPLGLGILAIEFVWARVLLKRFRDRAGSLGREFREAVGTRSKQRRSARAELGMNRRKAHDDTA